MARNPAMVPDGGQVAWVILLSALMTVTVRPWDDQASWNRFVASLPCPHFQQSWAWGDLAPSLGGEAIRLGATENGALLGGMQVFVNRLGILDRTMLYVPRGPALPAVEQRLLRPLLDAARDLGRERSALGLRLEPNVEAGDRAAEEVLSALGFRPTFPPSQPRSSWVLRITGSEEELLSGMKQKTRYNIRLSARRGVEVEEGTAADLDEFYSLYQVTAERDDFFIHPKELYRRMFALFETAGMFCMLLARHEGTVVAAITLVRFGNTCWYLHGASSNEHRNLMATYLLQWEGIRRAKRWECTTYDFRAVPDVLREDQDMYGVYRFKEGFGGHRYTTMHTWALPYRPGLFGAWQSYFSGRFALEAWRRRRAGLPARQFA